MSEITGKRGAGSGSGRELGEKVRQGREGGGDKPDLGVGASPGDVT